ncbi:MAG TPA: glutamate cyclase domain-containing protein, partial [Gemmataceae bacterium]|nr:glutamate cyclase domain-containing protein [Gemmataceae bacterium]
DATDNLISACFADFHGACHNLAKTANLSVAVVTGFYIPHAQPPCGETDGPLGALFLARALVPLGIEVLLVTDAFCLPALEAGITAAGLRKRVPLIPLPSPGRGEILSRHEYWDAFAERAGPITHLIALERVGPSHTADSLQAQPGTTPATIADFLGEIPADHHDRCHTMRGRDITANMSPAHYLFEVAVEAHPRIATIGIGDGGNEIGMGKIPWATIRRNIPNGGMVACRVPTDHLIVCGVSNWGAYGLAAGVRLLRGHEPDPGLFDVKRERDFLEHMVKQGPLVDGVTGRPDVSVDGLPFERYGEVLRRIGEIRTP